MSHFHRCCSCNNLKRCKNTYQAARVGHLPCIKQLLDEGKSWHCETLSIAAKQGYLPVLQFAIKSMKLKQYSDHVRYLMAKDWTKDIKYNALAKGHSHILRWIDECDQYDLPASIESGKLDCVRFMVETVVIDNGGGELNHELLLESLERACKMGFWHILAYLMQFCVSEKDLYTARDYVEPIVTTLREYGGKHNSHPIRRWGATPQFRDAFITLYNVSQQLDVTLDQPMELVSYILEQKEMLRIQTELARKECECLPEDIVKHIVVPYL